MPETVSQVNSNFQAYKAMKAEMEEKHMGKTALMHEERVVDIYNDEGDAYKVACEKYGLGNFSLVKIGARPVNLGFFTMFVDPD